MQAHFNVRTIESERIVQCTSLKLFEKLPFHSNVMNKPIFDKDLHKHLLKYKLYKI